jgi:hypothetical protein
MVSNGESCLLKHADVARFPIYESGSLADHLVAAGPER